MAEGRNSRKRPLEIEISQPIPPSQKLRISSEETTVCVDNSSDMVDTDTSNQEETLVCVPDATSGPNVSNLQTITKPIQLDTRASSSGCIASSSTTTPTRGWKYDVFLSFRGTDTRQGITADLRDSLQSRTIRTFMDDPDLRKGDPISPTLMEAIERSRFAVLVLSPHYADSPWCLEELVKICECMGNDSSENRIFPIFYDVEPTAVRHQEKGSFKEAFTKHEASGWHQPETMDKWRAALKQVADYSAWTTNAFKTHRELIDDVVQTFRKMVAPNAIEFTVDFQPYEETIKVMNEVNDALQNEEVTAVGIYGMGGVGKTTMVKHVAEQARRHGTFNRWIMVTISQNHKVKEIQDTLADFLGLELKKKTEAGRAAELHEEFMEREKLLIILDDVWDKIDLSKIGIPNSSELQNCSSKVLLTTRRRNICHVMGCQRTINLRCLSEQDSWTLFLRKARCSLESPTFEDVARKVAGECKGLPIALITVAMALGDKDLEEWKRAAKQLEKSQSANPDDNREAFKCIKLSYDYLKDEEHKSFFLLCCLFPEDNLISIYQVFLYGIGIGLFKADETLEEGYDTAVSVVKHLRYSSLLLDKGDTYGRFPDVVRDATIQRDQFLSLHDVVRDAGIRIAESERNFFVKAGCGLEVWPSKIPGGCTAISLMQNDIRKLPENWVCPPNLQILLLNQNHNIKEIPKTIFQSPNDLRVVDFSCILGEPFSLLYQSTISQLTNLTFLSLNKCDTSTLGKLEKLEILHLSNISGKFSIELGGLTNLRIFSCDDHFLHIIPPGVISKWKNLEELHMKNFQWWGCEGSGEETKNVGFEEVTSLPKLRVLLATVCAIQCLPENVDFVPEWVVSKFNITIGFGGSDNSLSRVISDKSIELVHHNISDLPKWFRDGLMKRAESLSLIGCRNLSDIYAEKLSLTGLDCEKSLEAVQTLPTGSLLNLKHLYLEDYYADGNALIPLSKLQILSNLERIDIKSTRNRYIFRHDELFVSLQLNIRHITLSDCSIIGICEGLALPTIFQNLQILVIGFCDKLEGSLFTHEVAQCLPQLDFLSLTRCTLLERIVEAGSNKTILPKLRKLFLLHCPLLYCESGSLDIECPSLETLVLSECPKFAASFDDFNSKKQQKPSSFFHS